MRDFDIAPDWLAICIELSSAIFDLGPKLNYWSDEADERKDNNNTVLSKSYLVGVIACLNLKKESSDDFFRWCSPRLATFTTSTNVCLHCCRLGLLATQAPDDFYANVEWRISIPRWMDKLALCSSRTMCAGLFRFPAYTRSTRLMDLSGRLRISSTLTQQYVFSIEVPWSHWHW